MDIQTPAVKWVLDGWQLAWHTLPQHMYTRIYCPGRHTLEIQTANLATKQEKILEQSYTNGIPLAGPVQLGVVFTTGCTFLLPPILHAAQHGVHIVVHSCPAAPPPLLPPIAHPLPHPSLLTPTIDKLGHTTMVVQLVYVVH